MIRVDEETYEELRQMGKYGDTMGDIIRKCVKTYKKVNKL